MSNRTKISAIVRTTTTTGTFLPTSISGCQFWLDATDSTTITKSGSSVTSIKEKAQNIVLTAQGTSSYLTVSPTSIGTQQSLWFDNATANRVYLSASYQSILTGCVFIVWKSLPQYTVSWFPIFTWYTGGQYPAYGYLGGTTNLTVGPYTTFASPNGTPQIVTTSGQTFITFYSWSGTTPTVGQNGATPTSGTHAAFSSSTTTFWVGADNGTNTNMYLGEMIIYNSVLGTTDRQTVEGYLAQKWGLTSSLPAGHLGLTTTIVGTTTVTLPKQKISSIPKTITLSFSPMSVAACALWLDAADPAGNGVVPANGATVSSWADKSGNSANGTAAGGAITYNLSAKGLTFNGSYFSLPNNTISPGAANYTIFCVVKPTIISNYPYLWYAGTGGPAGQSMCLVFYPTGEVENGFWTDFMGIAPAGTVAINNTYMFSSAYNGAVVGRVLYKNGTSVVSGTPTTTKNTQASSSVSIGGSQVLTGIYHELIVFNSFLGTSQRQTVESYLAQKWGLTASLPAGHPGLTTTVYGTTAATVRQKISFMSATAPVV